MANQPTAFSDFAPDKNPLEQGVITDMDAFYPTTAGYATLPGLVAAASALPSKCFGAFSGLVGGQFVTVLATASQLYILQGSSLISQGLSLNNTQNPWSFDVFGTDLIATNGVDPAQVSSGGGNFVPLGGAPPVSAIVAATDYSVFLIPPFSNQWLSSPADTIWVQNIATQTVSAPLTSTRGNITAAKSLRSGLAIYKNGAIHMGESTGPPLFWQFRIASNYTGTPGLRSVVNLGDVHYFVGVDDFYTFDGNSAERIPNNLRQFFFNDLDQNNAANIAGRYDPNRALIFFHYPSTAANPAGTLDKWVCYSLHTGKWAKGSQVIDLPLDGVVPTSQGMTYDQFGTKYGTYAGIASIPYNSSLFGASATANPGVVDSTHTLQLYTGTTAVLGSPFLTGNDIGDGNGIFRLGRVRPDFKSYPADGKATLNVLAARLKGQAPTQAASAQLTGDGWFDLVNSARLQRLQLQVSAPAEVVGYDTIDVAFDGEL